MNVQGECNSPLLEVITGNKIQMYEKHLWWHYVCMDYIQNHCNLNESNWLFPVHTLAFPWHHFLEHLLLLESSPGCLETLLDFFSPHHCGGPLHCHNWSSGPCISEKLVPVSSEFSNMGKLGIVICSNTLVWPLPSSHPVDATQDFSGQFFWAQRIFQFMDLTTGHHFKNDFKMRVITPPYFFNHTVSAFFF